MNVLDSPLEALAFNYVSFGFFTLANNLWTWIAVVTAAVSFWRIRVAGGVFPPEESPPRENRCSTKPSPENAAPVSSPPPEENAPSPSPSQSPSPTQFVGETRGSPKLALYYYYDSDTDGAVTVTETETETEESDGELTVTESDGDGDGEEWWGSWERALRTRMGKSVTAGWYRYQDLTELNGNVVRLWDDREQSHHCGAKRCVLW